MMLNKCCCNDLKTGGLIIGWISIFICIISFLSTIINLLNIREIIDVFIPEDKNVFDLDKKTVAHGLTVILSLEIVVNLIFLLTSVLMLKGINKEDKKLLIPYLLSLILAMIFIITFWVIVLNYLIQHNFSSTLVLCGSLLGSAGLGFQIFIFLVVCSLFKKMHSENSIENNVYTSAEFGGDSKDY